MRIGRSGLAADEGGSSERRGLGSDLAGSIVFDGARPKNVSFELGEQKPMRGGDRRESGETGRYPEVVSSSLTARGKYDRDGSVPSEVRGQLFADIASLEERFQVLKVKAERVSRGEYDDTNMVRADTHWPEVAMSESRRSDTSVKYGDSCEKPCRYATSTDEGDSGSDRGREVRGNRWGHRVGADGASRRVLDGAGSAVGRMGDRSSFLSWRWGR